MTLARRTTALRRAQLPLILLTCLALASTGCDAFNTTSNNSNTISGSCDAAGQSNSVQCESAEAASAAAAAGTPASQPAGPARPDGTQLGQYTITLPAGDYVPVGPTSPTRSEETTSPSGDLTYNTFSGVAYFAPNTPFSTIAPYNGVPTYEGCSQDLNTQSTVDAGQGDAFCLFESDPARTVGGIVTYIDQASINPDSVRVQLTVWSGTS